MGQSHNERSGLRNSPNRVLAIIVGVIIVAAILVTVLSSTKSVVQLDPGTPKGTVQVYLEAVFAGNNDKAAKFLAPESGCKVADLDRAYVMRNVRVDFVKSEIVGDTAQVWITVNIPTGGPFETFMTEDHTLRLIRLNGSWLLTGVPWPLYNCEVITQ